MANARKPANPDNRPFYKWGIYHVVNPKKLQGTVEARSNVDAKRKGKRLLKAVDSSYVIVTLIGPV